MPDHLLSRLADQRGSRAKSPDRCSECALHAPNDCISGIAHYPRSSLVSGSSMVYTSPVSENHRSSVDLEARGEQGGSGSIKGMMSRGGYGWSREAVRAALQVCRSVYGLGQAYIDSRAMGCAYRRSCASASGFVGELLRSPTTRNFAAVLGQCQCQCQCQSDPPFRFGRSVWDGIFHV